MKNKLTITMWSQIILLPFLFVVAVSLIMEVVDYGSEHKEGKKLEVKATIEKYAIQCYASEGSYPKNLAYLETEYGLIIDHETYFIDYDLFASNIMPEITVFDDDDYEGE